MVGLERAQRSLVRIAGQVWQDDSQGVFLPPWQRPLGYVFQEASLFDHMDVRGNLEYGQRRAPARKEAAAPKLFRFAMGISSVYRTAST